MVLCCRLLKSNYGTFIDALLYTNQRFTKFQRLRKKREVLPPEPTAEVEAKRAATTFTIQKYDVDLKTSLIAFLARKNRQISKIIGDGNCFFHEISWLFVNISVSTCQFDMMKRSLCAAMLTYLLPQQTIRLLAAKMNI